MALTKQFQLNVKALQEIAAAIEPAMGQDRAEIAGAFTDARLALDMSRSVAVEKLGGEMSESRLASIEGGSTPSIEEVWALICFMLEAFDDKGHAVKAKPKKRRKPPAKAAVEEEEEDLADVVSIDGSDDDDDDELEELDDDDDIEFEEEDGD